MMPPAATAILIGTGGAWHPQLVSRTLDRLARRIDRHRADDRDGRAGMTRIRFEDSEGVAVPADALCGSSVGRETPAARKPHQRVVVSHCGPVRVVSTRLHCYLSRLSCSESCDRESGSRAAISGPPSTDARSRLPSRPPEGQSISARSIRLKLSAQHII